MIYLQEINDYFKEMETVQLHILQYIESDDNCEIEFQKLLIFFQESKLSENLYKFKATLHLTAKISDNHCRKANFIEKIEKILQVFKEKMKFLTNDEIFLIFQKNKRILLFLFEERIIEPDHFIYSFFTRDENNVKCYSNYFYKEFKSFFDDEQQTEIKSSLNDDEVLFETKRKNGENDNFICELIRNDDINEFITQVNVKNVSLSSEITSSIFETNSFLLKRKPKLIEYSAFCGSIQIFKYLLLSKVDINSSIWLYAVHSGNNELIHILEENDIEPEFNNYLECYKESIKCFNSELADYFENNYLNDSLENVHYLKYYNYSYFPKSNSLFDFCKFDHSIPTQIYLKSIDYDFENQNETNALVIASKKGNVDIVKLLLECKGIDVNFIATFDILNSTKKEETTALTSSISKNYLEITQLLLQRKEINVNSILVQRKHRIKVKTINRAALFLAVSNQNVEIVRLLLNKKYIDVNFQSYLKYKNRYEAKTALIKAIEIGNSEIVNLLLNKPDINVNIESFEDKKYCQTKAIKTALFVAVEKGNIETIKLLLKRKDVDVNEKSIIIIKDVKSKKTPLCLSIEKSDIEIIKLLLMHSKIKVNEKSKWTEKTANNGKIKTIKSPLQIAIETNNYDIVKILLNCKKIDVNDISNTYIEKKSNERFFIFMMIAILTITILVYSSLNENQNLCYFCQLILFIMAIIFFQNFSSNFKFIFVNGIFEFIFKYNSQYAFNSVSICI